MESQIKTVIGTCLTIAFRNRTFGKDPPVVVWVCANRDVFDKRLAQLQEMSHVEIVQYGNSNFCE